MSSPVGPLWYRSSHIWSGAACSKQIGLRDCHKNALYHEKPYIDTRPSFPVFLTPQHLLFGMGTFEAW